MANRRKRILLVVDGSDQAFEVVNYVGKAVNLWQTEVVLFHVMDRVPETFWDWEKDPTSPLALEHMKNWETQKESQIREFMDRACLVLANAGVPDDAVKTTVVKRKEGIARDILSEAQKGYDAVALGRRGLGAVDESLLGSVASKILFTLTHIPLCLVGGKPRLGRILIGLDNSAGGLKAADFTAKMLAASNPSITLANILRLPIEYEQLISEDHAQEILESAENAIKPVFTKIRKSLVAAGVNPDRITAKVIKGAGSRALALLDEAKHGRYGTIVVGRRGVSEVPEFQMGRVAAKLTQISREVALWIVA